MLALVLAIATIVALLDLTAEGELTSNPESERGYDAIGRHFPPDPNEEYVTELILVRSGRMTVDDTAFRAKVGAVLASVRQSGVANNAESFYSSGDESLVSQTAPRRSSPSASGATARRAPVSSPASSRPRATTSSTSSCPGSAAPTAT